MRLTGIERIGLGNPPESLFFGTAACLNHLPMENRPTRCRAHPARYYRGND